MHVSTLIECLRSVQVPEEFDVDMQYWDDCCMAPEYAKEIFDYLKCREVGRR